MTEHRYANTEAAKMLANGLRSARDERGLSLREIGRRLGYKQAVVLSHMANGRVAVPTDRAPEIARQVGIAPEQFLKAVLLQHHPDVDWELIIGGPHEQLLGKPLSTLSPGHKRVLQEVVEDRWPEERWLSIREVAVVRLLRELFPQLHTDGLSAAERSTLQSCVELLREQK
jgi:transcriptional regulator with XRE-family HTH domain